VKVHKSTLFHTKYLKNFLGMSTAPSSDPSSAAEGTPYPQTLLPKHLWLLVSSPRWLKPLPHSKNPRYVPAPQGSPGPNVTSLGGGVQQPPSSCLQNFVPFRRPLSEISAAKLSIFCRHAGVTTKKYTVNDMYLHYMQRQ